MKKNILTLLTVIVATICIAQENNRLPLIEEGKVWRMLYSNEEISDIVPDYEYCYYIEGDTIIADITCKKLYSYNIDNNEQVQYQMALYENNKRVYFIPFQSDVSYVLYDFNTTVGKAVTINDVVQPHRTITMSTTEMRSVTINHRECQALLLNRVQEGYATQTEGWWIEGIGSELGLINTCGFEAAGNHHHFISCELNGEIIYDNEEFHDTISAINNTPADIISNNSKEAIYDLSGRKLNKKTTAGIYIQNGVKKLANRNK